ncbi:conserved Plasmodium protein, unknown function [Plasmodium sp. gorilla clade G2]|uniref:conserved Plasmodium protein, unknown function n=1 Tax=Plasmodium sp. gorilla clade G2 TaxID=880535 RepID=UPI000D209112|nr:conserved Plasmodium protein, unknown function [Plasmodium sp. gorilla clade G2]SOV17763.1 conserved Plasmodium protein, unknown function [Plasmodium sp. gorilla clade G2]
MNEYVKYTTSFYVFDLYKYNTSAEFLKSLQLITYEDIIIISLQNISDKNMKETYENIIDKQCNPNKAYVFLHLNYKFENDLFVLMIKKGLHNNIKDVYYKVIQIPTKNIFGKIYKKVIKYYFIDYIQKIINTNNNFIYNKYNNTTDSNNNNNNKNKNNDDDDDDDDNGESYYINEEKKKDFNVIIRNDMLLYEMNHKKYFNYINKYFQHANDINEKNERVDTMLNHFLPHQYKIDQYMILKKKSNLNYEKKKRKIIMSNKYCYDNTYNNNSGSYHYNSDSILLRNKKEIYNINRNICNMKNKEEIYTHNNINNNNINYISFNKKKYDRNILHCLTLMINNIRFCICFSNFDIYKYIQSKNYYQYIFYKERIKKFYNDKENSPFYINYMNYYLNMYTTFCKQLYNHFINKIIFETKKEDMYLFNMDIIIFIGFDKLVLCNINENIESEKNKHIYINMKKKQNEYLSNNSIFFDKNIIIFNKNTHHFLIQKYYKTLINKNKLNHILPIGFKSVCDLYTLIKINIIDDFFLYHTYNKHEQQYSLINHLKTKIKKNKKKNITISVEPNIINLNVINTYEIYHTSFEICYDYKEIEENNIYTYEKSHHHHNNKKKLCQLTSSPFLVNNNNNNTKLCDKKYYEEQKDERYSSDRNDDACCVIISGHKKDKKIDEMKNKNIDEMKNKNIDEMKNKNIDEMKNKNIGQRKNKNIDQMKNKNIDQMKNKNIDQMKNKNIGQMKNKNIGQMKNKNTLERKYQNIRVPYNNYKQINDPIGDHINDRNDNTMQKNKNNLTNMSSNNMTKERKKHNYLFHLLHMNSRKKRKQKKKQKKKICEINTLERKEEIQNDFKNQHIYHIQKNCNCNDSTHLNYISDDYNKRESYRETYKHNNIHEQINKENISKDDIYINKKSTDINNDDDLYFSVLCFDAQTKSTIPINLYSFLHLKKNTIFKYLEENIRFKEQTQNINDNNNNILINHNDNMKSIENINNMKKRRKKKIHNNENTYTFATARYIYMQPYTGIIKKNTRKKIELNIFIEHILKSQRIKDSFVLIIRIHNFDKDIFLTIKCHIQNNIITSLIHDNLSLLKKKKKYMQNGNTHAGVIYSSDCDNIKNKKTIKRKYKIKKNKMNYTFHHMTNMSLLRYTCNKKIRRSIKNQTENKVDNNIMLHKMDITNNISYNNNKEIPCEIQNRLLKNDSNSLLKNIINNKNMFKYNIKKKKRGTYFLSRNFIKFLFFLFFHINKQQEILFTSTTNEEKIEDLLYFFNLSNMNYYHLLYSFHYIFQISNENIDMCTYNYNCKKRFFDMVQRNIRKNRNDAIYNEYDERSDKINDIQMKKYFFNNNNNNNDNNNNYYYNNCCIDNSFFIHDKQRDIKHLDNDSNVIYNITYLIRKIEKNKKIENDISIISLLLLCEQFFYIINTNIITSQYLSYIKNIYNNMNIKKKKKMYFIFLILLRNSFTCIYYKNIFLVFISFIKKLFIYFLQLNIQHFYVTVMRQNDIIKNKNMKKINKTKERNKYNHNINNDNKTVDNNKNDDNIYINTFKEHNYQQHTKNNKLKYYFDLFLNSFNFFHNAFIIYISSFIFSFLDIQIAIDLTHYILFYL